MRPILTSRSRLRDRAVATLSLLLLPGAMSVVTAETPSAAAEPGGERFVRLVGDDSSVVRAAEVGLPTGTTGLQTSTYSMVAATWQGATPRIAVRTATDSPWRRLPVIEDGPSPGAGEGVPGQRATELFWTGPATDIDVRVAGIGHRELRLVLIEPGDLPSDDDAAASAPVRSAAAAGSAPPPQLRTRRDWGADPRWRNGRPRYSDRLRQVHVHHTATGNSYRRSDVPGLIRGMYRYHTRSLGWFDIGYNFLVDRFGRTWVGRSGGVNRLVRGAHTLGFNEDSVGVAMIGTLTSRRPWRPAVTTLTRVAAWKLDRHGRQATGRVRVTSTGSDRYRDGRRVRLPVIDGHRDTNDTACPGKRLYDRLPTIRRRTQARIDRFD